MTVDLAIIITASLGAVDISKLTRKLLVVE